MTISLDALPDKVALKHIQNALWGLSETRGAAIMIGAGLSRAAIRSSGDAPPIPLWSEMATALKADLYPNGGGPTDFLRLAQEYEAALGRPALNELIRIKIDDPNLKVGQIHEDLVALPWTDILTTNWDTLLERAASINPNRAYSTVATIGDISRTRAPRIIKLHGTLPSHTPFIFTEEDFRSYPRSFAPFVNLAQQILMENVLCLVGFSGDDPNFLNWSGWVRDHLGNNAPTIFLVGALDLSSSKRRMLEQRRVSPIDFSPVLQHLDPELRHAEAVRLFLNILREGKPWPRHLWPKDEIEVEEETDAANAEHNPGPTPSFGNKQLRLWRCERETYPGWLICPADARLAFRHSMVHWAGLEKDIEALPREEQLRASYERGWYFDRALQPLPNALVDGLVAALAATPPVLSRDQRHEVAYWLMRHGREQRDWQFFANWKAFIKSDPMSPYLPHAAWEQALWARDELSFEQLELLIETIQGDDPIWGLRRAALLAELYKESEMAAEIAAAVQELRVRAAGDRTSIWIASRLAWATFASDKLGTWNLVKRFPADVLVERYNEPWSLPFKKLRCDPTEECTRLEADLDEAIEQRARPSYQSTPSFDVGRTSSTLYQVGNGRVRDLTDVLRFIDQCGVPRSTLEWNLLNGLHGKWLKLEGPASLKSLLLIVRHPWPANDFDNIIDRRAVATMDQNLADQGFQAVCGHMRYCLTKAAGFHRAEGAWRVGAHWYAQAASCAELASRLVLRVSARQASDTVETVFEILSRGLVDDPGVWVALGNLLTRALDTLTDEEQEKFLLPATELRLAPEGTGHSHGDWPDVLSEIQFHAIHRNENEHRWSRAIDSLIDAHRAGGQKRSRAFGRLVKLNEAGALSDKEKVAWTDVLWGSIDPGTGLPEGTGFYSSIFLTLPEPNEGQARKLFCDHILVAGEGALSEDQLVSASNAAAYLPAKSRAYLSVEQAVIWLDKLSKGPKKRAPDRFPFSRTVWDLNLGWCLANAVLPKVSADDLGEERLAVLLSEDAPYGVITGLPHLLLNRPDLADRVLSRIRAALVSDNPMIFNCACGAVVELGRLQGQDYLLPGGVSDLYSEIASAVQQRRPEFVLESVDIAKWLVAKGLFSEVDLRRIDIGLSYLLVELDYRSERSKAFEQLFLLRRYVVELVRILVHMGRETAATRGWMGAAENDPMPEVKAALAKPIKVLLEVE